MFRCVLQRKKEYFNVKHILEKKSHLDAEDSTIGEFTVTDTDTNKIIFKSFCIENGGPSTDESGQDKRIVARKYLLKWKTPTSITVPDDYNVNGVKTAIHLYTPELPDFEKRAILIHIGNSPQDTRGCLLLGDGEDKKGSVTNSSVACKRFYDLVKEKGIENFELEIKEIE